MNNGKDYKDLEAGEALAETRADEYAKTLYDLEKKDGY